MSTIAQLRLSSDLMLHYLLDQPWHEKCEVIPNHVPRQAPEGTKPIVIVRYNDGTAHPPYLRYSAGPKQGFFWDIYGADFHNVELAVIALSHAPAPVKVGPLTFKLQLDPGTEGHHE